MNKLLRYTKYSGNYRWCVPAIGHWLHCNSNNISFSCFKEYATNVPTPLDLQLWPFSRQLHTICLRLKKSDANTSPADVFLAAWGTGDLRCSFCFDCSGSCDLLLTEVKQVIWELGIYFVLFFFLRVSTASRPTQGSPWIRKRTKSMQVVTANLPRFPLCGDSDRGARTEDPFTGTSWDCVISHRKWKHNNKKMGTTKYTVVHLSQIRLTWKCIYTSEIYPKKVSPWKCSKYVSSSWLIIKSHRFTCKVMRKNLCDD